MTGLEKIIKQIQDEAEASAAKVIAEAQAKAQEIRAKAQEDAQSKRAAIEEQTAHEVEMIASSAKSAASLAIRRAVLAAKQEVINGVIVKARESILSLPDDEYFALILKMAQKYSLPQPGEAYFSQADLNRMPSDFAKKLEAASKGGLAVAKQPRPIDGGFILVYGGVEENCSIEALFYAEQERLQDKVQAFLFV